MRIQTLMDADAKAVHEAEEEIFSDAWSEASIKSAARAKGAVCFALFCEERLAGYVLGQEVCGEAELHRIAVLPEERGKGFGDELMREFIRRCEGAAAYTQFLEVRAGNRPALSLYQKYGFSEEGRRTHYYHNPVEDALLLRRQIQET
ncbi:MAG: ribosomal protein S18-alanine N-acetyltransferase [Lachnospiraceae bacterium]|nr:ribosomal protein S18-alanine N-acetyltransferase [Lachnospiraceae bacterium]